LNERERTYSIEVSSVSDQNYGFTELGDEHNAQNASVNRVWLKRETDKNEFKLEKDETNCHRFLIDEK